MIFYFYFTVTLLFVCTKLPYNNRVPGKVYAQIIDATVALHLPRPMHYRVVKKKLTTGNDVFIVAVIFPLYSFTLSVVV